MDAALYATAWAAVALFVAGEAGKRGRLAEVSGVRWAWPLWFAGALLCAGHSALAFAVHYGWQHDAALRATAAQTRAVYGLNWGGGIYVNYLFIAAWFAEALWWRWDPQRYFARPTIVTHVCRAFFFIVLLNATVIFAAPGRRALGTVLMTALVLAWSRPWTADRRLRQATATDDCDC
jgi:hypothetical protein